MDFAEQYATSFDDTKIYYMTKGSGPAICACNGIGVSVFFWKYLAEYFVKDHKVILWDYRSHGKSGAAPDYSGLTMSTNALDLKAVLDAAGIEKVVLLGHSMGVQTIYEFYRMFPERVAALIPVLGSYGQPMNTFLHTDKMKYFFPVAYRFANCFPHFSTRMTQTMYEVLFKDPLPFIGGKAIRFINSQHFRKDDLIPYLDHLRTLDLRAFLGMARRMQEHTAKDWLHEIKVPTLIIAGQDDLFTPWRISAEMHKLIPESELLTIPRGSHAALVEQPELMNLRIEKFFRERLAKSQWEASGKKAKPRTPRRAAPKTV
ncbi:MAG: alpha/beta hydrolase [Deltaproteobacteria bacterium]|nr:alpha/beta hydrolase [Deltaproteobacteria bacterium]